VRLPKVAGSLQLALRKRVDHAVMRLLLLLVGWCLLLVLCWPLALLLLVLAPLLWLLSLPIRLVLLCVNAIFSFLKAVLFLPARLLGERTR
jgi:hypothetical protein